jgi:hypothetical protein
MERYHNDVVEDHAPGFLDQSITSIGHEGGSDPLDQRVKRGIGIAGRAPAPARL